MEDSYLTLIRNVGDLGQLLHNLHEENNKLKQENSLIKLENLLLKDELEETLNNLTTATSPATPLRTSRNGRKSGNTAIVTNRRESTIIIEQKYNLLKQEFDRTKDENELKVAELIKRLNAQIKLVHQAHNTNTPSEVLPKIPSRKNSKSNYSAIHKPTSSMIDAAPTVLITPLSNEKKLPKEKVITIENNRYLTFVMKKKKVKIDIFSIRATMPDDSTIVITYNHRNSEEVYLIKFKNEITAKRWFERLSTEGVPTPRDGDTLIASRSESELNENHSAPLSRSNTEENLAERMRTSHRRMHSEGGEEAEDHVDGNGRRGTVIRLTDECQRRGTVYSAMTSEPEVLEIPLIPLSELNQREYDSRSSDNYNVISESSSSGSTEPGSEQEGSAWVSGEKELLRNKFHFSRPDIPTGQPRKLSMYKK